MNVLTRTPVPAKRSSAASFSLAAFMPWVDRSGAGATTARLPRGVWIAGGLMVLTIVALATTLAVKSGNAPAPAAAAPAAVAPPEQAMTPLAVVGATATPGAPIAAAVTPPAPAATPTPQQVVSAPVCTSCGVIESYNPVQVQGATNGVGAVAGGVGGAVIGSKIAGRGNHTVGGLVGAIGGGLLGNAVEKHVRVYTVYDVHVRMDDGSVRTVRQSHAPAVGAHVTVDGKTLHPAPIAAQAS